MITYILEITKGHWRERNFCCCEAILWSLSHSKSLFYNFYKNFSRSEILFEGGRKTNLCMLPSTSVRILLKIIHSEKRLDLKDLNWSFTAKKRFVLNDTCQSAPGVQPVNHSLEPQYSHFLTQYSPEPGLGPLVVLWTEWRRPKYWACTACVAKSPDVRPLLATLIRLVTSSLISSGVSDEFFNNENMKNEKNITKPHDGNSFVGFSEPTQNLMLDLDLISDSRIKFD